MILEFINGNTIEFVDSADNIRGASSKHIQFFKPIEFLVTYADETGNEIDRLSFGYSENEVIQRCKQDGLNVLGIKQI